MAVYTKDELKKRSIDAFPNNNVGAIQPADHRQFNDDLIDSMATSAQGVKADNAVQSATIDGMVVPKENGVLRFPKLGQEFATFVVDSNEALVAWANNEAENDYTTVLVKSGTWQVNKGINLTESKTQRIYGEPNSKIEFNVSYGKQCLYYSINVENQNDYLIHGLTLEGLSPSIVLFSNCFNLHNCTAIVYKDSESGDCCYANCKVLTNCNAIGTASEDGDTTCFETCKDLTNCHSLRGYEAFSYCERLNNCISEESVEIDFFACEGLQNCIAISNANMAGFLQCNRVFNCEVRNVEDGFWECNDVSYCRAHSSGYGFGHCNSLTSCYTSNSPSIGYYYCKGMLFNKTLASSKYISCTVIEGGQEVSATYQGGFNT